MGQNNREIVAIKFDFLEIVYYICCSSLFQLNAKTKNTTKVAPSPFVLKKEK